MLGLVLMLAPTPLSPPEPPAAVELIWDAPDECPSATDVESLYRDLLISKPTGEGIMHAHGVVRRDGGTWRLELVTRMGEYTDVRKLQAAHCDELGEAAATLFAVAVDLELASEPEAVVEAMEPEPEPEPAPQLPVVVEMPAPPSTPQQQPEPDLPPARRRLPLYLLAAVGAESGALPGPTARVSAGLGYARRWARVEGDVMWLAPRRIPGTFGDAQVQVVGAAARGCGVPGAGRWEFPVCFGFEAGATVARVSRADGADLVAGRWFAPLLRAAAVLRGRRFGGMLALEGAGPLLSTPVRVDDFTVFESRAGSVRGILGLEFYFFPEAHRFGRARTSTR